MGLFNRDKPQQAQQPQQPGFMQQAMAMQRQALAMQQQAMQQAAAMQQAMQQVSQGQGQGASPNSSPQVGSGLWIRQVLAIIAPPQPGHVKRCSCVVCGAPKKLPSVTAYVYCDYCACLVDYDLRRACESDTTPGPQYAAVVNSVNAASMAAQAAGDRDRYRELQKQLFEAYVQYVPLAVSHRAKNDQAYRAAYVSYQAETAVARAFDPASQALEAELAQRVRGLRYGGPMMSPVIEPESFWPLVDIVERRHEHYRTLNRSLGLTDLDPDRADHLNAKFGWSQFCQGWLGMLPPEAGQQLLARAGLANEYVPVQADDGQPRHCGGCGAQFQSLPGAAAMICEGCGRKIDVGAAELSCATCGGSMTLPAGADHIACPFCQSDVRRTGMR